jgi:uncharacterized protein YkwD
MGMKKFPLAVLLLALATSLTFAAGASARGFSAAEIASLETCPNQTEPALSPAEQAEVMLCLTNFARGTNGLAPLIASKQLSHAAEQKSADIVNCDEFSHEACGRPFTFWDQRYGYLKGCWKAGENIAWGTGTYSTVRATFIAWLESPEHHANILGPYKEAGMAMRVGDLEGKEEAAVWTQDFGSHKC